MRCRRSSATSPTRSAGRLEACSTAITRSSTRRSAAPSQRSDPTICCSSFRGMGWSRSGSAGAVDSSRLSWIATARQLGPVGYRDPAGAISPDGRWIAYSEGRFLRVRPVDGGPSLEFTPGNAQIRTLAWTPDSRTILADGDHAQSDWAEYDLAGTRRSIADGARRASEMRRACVKLI